MTLDQIRNDPHGYGGHLANILGKQGISDPAILQKMFDWWIETGFREYIRIKSDHDRNGVLDREKIWAESGKLVNQKLKEIQE